MIVRGKRKENKPYNDAMSQEEKDRITKYIEYINNLNPKSFFSESMWDELSLYQKLYLNILWKTRNLNTFYFRRR